MGLTGLTAGCAQGRSFPQALEGRLFPGLFHFLEVSCVHGLCPLRSSSKPAGPHLSLWPSVSPSDPTQEVHPGDSPSEVQLEGYKTGPCSGSQHPVQHKELAGMHTTRPRLQRRSSRRSGGSSGMAWTPGSPEAPRRPAHTGGQRTRGCGEGSVRHTYLVTVGYFQGGSPPANVSRV